MRCAHAQVVRAVQPVQAEARRVRLASLVVVPPRDCPDVAEEVHRGRVGATHGPRLRAVVDSPYATRRKVDEQLKVPMRALAYREQQAVRVLARVRYQLPVLNLLGVIVRVDGEAKVGRFGSARSFFYARWTTHRFHERRPSYVFGL